MTKHRETPVTFTHEEARTIREAMGRSLESIECPRCAGLLKVSDPMTREGSIGMSYEVSCEPCHRVAIITEVPGTRRSDPNAAFE